MKSSARHIAVTSVDPNGNSVVFSPSSSHYAARGLDGMSARGNFSSRSCNNTFIGGGGYARRMSTGSSPSSSYGGRPPFGNGEGLFEVTTGVACGISDHPMACGIVFSSIDEKTVMQNLNDRLAGFLDKVRRLEVENTKLESKIRHFHMKHGLVMKQKDYSHYYHQIEELKKQIIHVTVENNKILLKIDNDHINFEDIKQKLEIECGARENAEADLNGLHPILEELVSCKCHLETELQFLQEELNNLKKAHKEELTHLKKQSHDVNMEVSTSPGPDLKKILQEMRCKYEAMIDSNRKEVAQWYETKLEEANLEICTWNQEAEDGNHKVMDLKRQLLALAIDLQAQCKMRDTLQMSLAETKCHYYTQLAKIQDEVARVEHQLIELHLEMKNQDEEYKALLNVKKRLEQEIQMYRNLLEEGKDA